MRTFVLTFLLLAGGAAMFDETLQAAPPVQGRAFPQVTPGLSFTPAANLYAPNPFFGTRFYGYGLSGSPRSYDPNFLIFRSPGQRYHSLRYTDPFVAPWFSYNKGAPLADSSRTAGRSSSLDFMPYCPD